MLSSDNHKGRWLRQFGSLYELTRYLETTPKVWRGNAARDNRSTLGWDLGHGYDGALQRARDGWEEGVRNIDALVTAVPLESHVTLGYSVAGDFPDVPRAVAGDPFNMVRRGRDRTPKAIITIAVNIRISAAISAKSMTNYGAALVALVDRLETRGVRVELLGLCATNRHDHIDWNRWAISWTIKHAEDPLDLSAVAFSLAHPGMFRRLGFAVMERSPKMDYGYGIDGGISADDFLDIPDQALLIKGVDHNPGVCATMEGALAFAQQNINAAAVAVLGAPIAELEEVL